MLKTFLTAAILGSEFLSPLAGSAEPMPPAEPTAMHARMDHRGGNLGRHHEHRHHHHY